jgi:uncharacterized membrane protein
MRTNSKNKWVDYTIFGLFIFLLFCLIFESYIQLPNLIGWLGHWHPLVLHFPIVLIIITIFLSFTGKNTPYLLLVTATLTALITAITGFILGLESSSKGDLLLYHQWFGSCVAIIMTVWYWFESIHFKNIYLLKGLQIVLVILIGLTGHYGGMITHGEDFLDIPKNKKDKTLPENPLIYEHVVSAILENNCVSCHNLNKQKGELLMTNLNNLIKGGESGNTLIPFEPNNSELIKRLHLPIKDEAHMPPEGKEPLNSHDIQILERWIALGASDTLKLNHLENNEPLAILINELIKPNETESWEKLLKVTDETILELTSEYVTIKRISNNSNALSIDVYLPPEYNPKFILNLKPIAKNIIELDLSGLPLDEKEMQLITTCENLEWLELDRTPLTDKNVESLKSLSKLKILKVFGTKITEKSLKIFKTLDNLKSLYLWDTHISEDALKKFILEIPSLTINNGISKDLQDSFRPSGIDSLKSTLTN